MKKLIIAALMGCFFMTNAMANNAIWSKVNGWEIHGNSKLKFCMATMEWVNGAKISFAHTKNGWVMYIWTPTGDPSLTVGQEQPMKITTDSGINDIFTAIVVETNFIRIPDLTPEAAYAFAKAHYIQFADNPELRFNMSGSYKALLTVMKCYRALNGEEASAYKQATPV